MADGVGFWSSLKRGGPLEIVYKVGEAIWSYLYPLIIPVAAAMIAALGSWYAYFSTLDPLVRFALLLFSLGSLIWVVRQLLNFRGVPQKQPALYVPNLNHPDVGRFAEFRLPSNWGLHFKRCQLSPENGIQLEAEELHLDVRVLQRMQNVKFDIIVKNVTGKKVGDVICRVPSGTLQGVVQKGTDQQYVLMSRLFWNAHAAYIHPGTGQQNHTLVRVENKVIFLPENPSLRFTGIIGQRYAFEIKLLHDHGSETASFTIALERGAISPQSQLKDISGFEPTSQTYAGATSFM